MVGGTGSPPQPHPGQILCTDSQESTGTTVKACISLFLRSLRRVIKWIGFLRPWVYLPPSLHALHFVQSSLHSGRDADHLALTKGIAWARGLTEHLSLASPPRPPNCAGCRKDLPPASFGELLCGTRVLTLRSARRCPPAHPLGARPLVPRSRSSSPSQCLPGALTS